MRLAGGSSENCDPGEKPQELRDRTGASMGAPGSMSTSSCIVVLCCLSSLRQASLPLRLHQFTAKCNRTQRNCGKPVRSRCREALKEARGDLEEARSSL